MDILGVADMPADQTFTGISSEAVQLKENFVSWRYNVCFNGRYLEKNAKVTPIEHTKHICLFCVPH